jgi:hypothetical protein
MDATRKLAAEQAGKIIQTSRDAEARVRTAILDARQGES